MRDLVDHLAAVLRERAPTMVEAAALGFVERADGALFTPTADDRKAARRLRRGLARSLAERDFVSVKPAAGWRGFVTAATSFLEGQAHEHLVIGLGRVAGHRMTLREAIVWAGSESRVRLPDSAQARVGGHLQDPNDDAAAIVHVHNHPDGMIRFIKNALLGEHPLASGADRDVRAVHEAAARAAARTGWDPRRVRFFVVENGATHEYTLPRLLPLLAAFLG